MEINHRIIQNDQATHELYVQQGMNNMSFWKEKFQISQNAKKNLIILMQNSNSVCSYEFPYLTTSITCCRLINDRIIVIPNDNDNDNDDDCVL